ncbi:threonine aldolase family protein [Streptomyces decoyicus]|uniref:threonine aldolase family protein n=1 Tax=Streptomyces decoyicus TaxID=249567 RepID=UPI00387057DB
MTIDLRSDTVTRPTPAMRAAMARAELGDDGYREDPSVRALEEEMADLFGHEAALFVPSGHMANLVAVAAQTHPGDGLLLDEMSHIFRSERGWPERITRLRLHTEAPAESVTVACVEQTQGNRGGRVLPPDALDRHRGATVRVHCDGARVWNAAAATGIGLAEYGARVDTLAACFSKGLGAPVGSAVVGSRETIARARDWRHLLGGRMRQAGVLAAAAHHGLREHRARLVDDHANAALLAAALQPWLEVPVETNIVFLRTPGSAPAVEERCREQGVLVRAFGADQIRIVTHLDVGTAQVTQAADVLAQVLSSTGEHSRTDSSRST